MSASSQAELERVLGSAWHVNAIEVNKRLGHAENAGDPNGSVTPLFVGQMLRDTTNNVFYIAKGTANTDWVLVAGAGVANLFWVDVAVTAAALDGAGSAVVKAGTAGDTYKIREIRLIGGGTNFGAGGDRTIVLTDGTTTWTTIANADIEAAPANTLHWGDAKVPSSGATANTASVAGQNIRFQYAGGTTDHGGAGSISFQVQLEKVS